MPLACLSVFLLSKSCFGLILELLDIWERFRGKADRWGRAIWPTFHPLVGRCSGRIELRAARKLLAYPLQSLRASVRERALRYVASMSAIMR